MNTMYFGVPQSRQRLIFIGVRDDLGIEPSHPAAQGKPITFNEAVGCLDSLHMNEQLHHIWIPAKEGSKTFMALLKTPPGQTLKGFTMSRRIDGCKPCPTIQTGGVAPGYPSSSWLSHPTQNRGISIREACRCHSFCDSFTFHDWRDGAKRIGNSVPPRFMQAIAEHIRDNTLSDLGLTPRRVTTAQTGQL
jgi:DNA (cytosine-5)-methyltransferase 1